MRGKPGPRSGLRSCRQRPRSRTVIVTSPSSCSSPGSRCRLREQQERNPHGDEIVVGDATQGAALAADDETGAGISARDADGEEADAS